jgi:hypothetical protein
MKMIRWFVVLLCATALASNAPRGTVPRATPDKYDAHAEQNGLGIGATMLSANEAHKALSTDVDRCCMVVEVALFPARDGLTEVSLSDFVLRVVGEDTARRPSSPELVAGKLQKKSEPEADNHDVVISPTAGVGYERGGIDPVTGQPRRGGVVTSTGVGVGIGGPQAPKPGSSDADRRTMELELREKGLPEGSTSAPVSGYLYFSLQKKKSVKYQLQYLTNGNVVTLALK